MFSGTVRSNLDPYDEHTDYELWSVIKEANLMTMVAAVGGLEGKVDGSGSQNISLGQAQLVCLCRAALRKVSPLPRLLSSSVLYMLLLHQQSCA